jgi:hypothetical protein
MSEEKTFVIPPTDVRTEGFIDAINSGVTALDAASLDEVPYMTLVTADDGEPFTGKVIGFGSSYRESHLNHNPGSTPPKGVRCSGCRWTDTFIVRVPTTSVDSTGLKADNSGVVQSGAPMYVLISLGKSAIDGESMRQTVIWTPDAAEILRKLFVPTKPGFKHDTGGKAVPPHNGAAFREAARVDSAFAALLDQYADAIPDPTQRGADADPLAGL